MAKKIQPAMRAVNFGFILGPSFRYRVCFRNDKLLLDNGLHQKKSEKEAVPVFRAEIDVESGGWETPTPIAMTVSLKFAFRPALPGGYTTLFLRPRALVEHCDDVELNRIDNFEDHHIDAIMLD